MDSLDWAQFRSKAVFGYIPVHYWAIDGDIILSVNAKNGSPEGGYLLRVVTFCWRGVTFSTAVCLHVVSLFCHGIGQANAWYRWKRSDTKSCWRRLRLVSAIWDCVHSINVY